MGTKLRRCVGRLVLEKYNGDVWRADGWKYISGGVSRENSRVYRFKATWLSYPIGSGVRVSRRAEA